MRILHIVSSVAVGGMERFSESLALEQIRRDNDVSLLLPGDLAFDPIEARLNAAGVHVHRFKLDAGGGRLAQLMRTPSLISLLRRSRPDVVHVHLPGSTGGVVAALAVRLFTPA